MTFTCVCVFCRSLLYSHCCYLFFGVYIKHKENSMEVLSYYNECMQQRNLQSVFVFLLQFDKMPWFVVVLSAIFQNETEQGQNVTFVVEKQ